METVTALLGALLSFVFEHAPGLSTWFHGLSVNGKRVIVAIASGIIGLAVWGLACDPLGLDCTLEGFPAVFGAISGAIWAFLSSQAAHVFFRKRA